MGVGDTGISEAVTVKVGGTKVSAGGIVGAEGSTGVAVGGIDIGGGTYFSMFSVVGVIAIAGVCVSP